MRSATRLRPARLLGVDADLREVWHTVLHELPRLRIGRHGQLQEWLEDYEESEPGHRHLSHLFGVFPGDQITLDRDPELAAAARVSLERRLANSGEPHSWRSAWNVALWARFREGRARLSLSAYRLAGRRPLSRDEPLYEGTARRQLWAGSGHHRDADAESLRGAAAVAGTAQGVGVGQGDRPTGEGRLRDRHRLGCGNTHRGAHGRTAARTLRRSREP